MNPIVLAAPKCSAVKHLSSRIRKNSGLWVYPRSLATSATAICRGSSRTEMLHRIARNAFVWVAPDVDSTSDTDEHDGYAKCSVILTPNGVSCFCANHGIVRFCTRTIRGRPESVGNTRRHSAPRIQDSHGLGGNVQPQRQRDLARIPFGACSRFEDSSTTAIQTRGGELDHD